MFECAVVWQDPGRDLALLAVDQAKAGAWTAAVGRGHGPAVAEPGTVGLPAERLATRMRRWTMTSLILSWCLAS